jgi:hypothetical protein
MPDDSLYRPLTRREREEMVSRGLLNLGDPRISMAQEPALFVNKYTGSICVAARERQSELLDFNARMSGFSSAVATFPLKQKYVGEDRIPCAAGLVKYLTPEERAAYRLEVRDGKLYDASGQPFDTRDVRSTTGSDARAIFVMDAEGNLFAAKTQTLHHSSFLAGADVTAAGEMAVEQGVLKLVTRQSGHYRPKAAGSVNLRNALHARGVNLGETRWVKWEGYLG